MRPRSNRKTSTLSAVNLKKHLTSMSCKLESAIWSRDTGQRIPCFDRCQLIITWMSNIKEVHSNPRLHVSVNPLFGAWPPCRRRRRAYAPTSYTACRITTRKSIHRFPSVSYMGMGLRLAALQAAGAPLLLFLYSWLFSPHSASICWIVHGHRTSSNETVYR